MKKHLELSKYAMDMSAEELKAEFLGVEKAVVLDMSDKELKKAISKVPKAVLMRTLILNERDFLRVTEERAIRGLWYAMIKPVLSRLGVLIDDTEETMSRWDKDLSKYLADLVREGVMTYLDLLIVDESRRKGTPEEQFQFSEAYGYQVSVAAYPNLILCVEKDTVCSLAKDLADLFGCSYISGAGKNAFAATEGLLREIKEKTEDILRKIKEKMAGVDRWDIHLLVISDYDPTGFIIADVFINQINHLKRNLGVDGIEVYTERIGIVPDQLTQDEIEKNKYTPSTQGLKKWVVKTGGIGTDKDKEILRKEGEGGLSAERLREISKGIELDALPPERIRELFVTSLRKHVDPEIYSDVMKKSLIKKKILENVQPHVKKIINEISPRLSARVNFDIFDAAISGQRNLPVDQGECDNDDEEIKKMVRAYFK